MLDESKSIELRHVEVEQRQITSLPIEEVARGLAVRRGQDAKAAARQRARQDAAEIVVVLGEQDRALTRAEHLLDLV